MAEHHNRLDSKVRLLMHSGQVGLHEHKRERWKEVQVSASQLALLEVTMRRLDRQDAWILNSQGGSGENVFLVSYCPSASSGCRLTHVACAAQASRDSNDWPNTDRSNSTHSA